jgi:hypothetical protein
VPSPHGSCEGSADKDDDCTSGCPLDLNDTFEFPHLMIPVDQSKPDKTHGTNFNGTITDKACTIYNFDVRPSLAGQSCSLVWLFPEQKDLETSSFTYSGSKKPTMEVSHVHKPADEHTTWNKVGAKDVVAKGPVVPGQNFNALTMECPGGQKVAYMLCGKDVSLNYFQDFNPSPIGLYMRAC